MGRSLRADHRARRGRRAGGADGGLLPGQLRTAPSPAAGSAIEETENFQKVWAPEGRTPAEGEVFANPGLARTLRLIAEGGREGFYEGEVAETIERYFARIGGWLSKADLAAHRGEWVTPATITYRGVDVWGLPPNGQGLSTLQMLNMLERFDLAGMGFLSAARPAPHGRGQAPGVRGPRPLLRRPGVRRRSRSSG